MTVVPAAHDPDFDKWALAQLRLYKPFRRENELHIPSMSDCFHSFLNRGGFPAIVHRDVLLETVENGDEPEVSLFGNITQDSILQQDNYQLLLNSGCVPNDNSLLLGMREADLSHHWPHSWFNFTFEQLLSWLPNTIKKTVLHRTVSQLSDKKSLSNMQNKAFALVYKYTFGLLLNEQLLMIVIGTAGVLSVGPHG